MRPLIPSETPAARDARVLRGRHRSAVARLKRLVRERLRSGDATISVNEIRCHEAGCPGLETVVLILATGRSPRRLRFLKPVAEVNAADVDALMPGP